MKIEYTNEAQRVINLTTFLSEAFTQINRDTPDTFAILLMMADMGTLVVELIVEEKENPYHLKGDKVYKIGFSNKVLPTGNKEPVTILTVLVEDRLMVSSLLSSEVEFMTLHLLSKVTKKRSKISEGITL